MLDYTLSKNTLIKMIKSFKRRNHDKENRVLYKTEKQQQLLITEEDKSDKSTETKKDNQIKRKKSILE
jgi:hypothetical protein